MKILFIDPPSKKSSRQGQRGSSLNLSIATLASVLAKNGHQVSLFDMVNHHENRYIDKIRKALEVFRPDIIGVSILNAQYLFGVEVIKKLRGMTSLPIVVGGPEITAIENKIFIDTDYAVDLAVLGEGEDTLIKILDSLSKKEKGTFEEIQGVIINKNGNLIKTGAAQSVGDLNSYPSPDLSLFGVKKLALYNIMASRGCPFNCSFCFSYSKKWRTRTNVNIIAELCEAKQKYNFTKYRFFDPLFNITKDRVHSICDAIMQSDLHGIPWETMGVRADKLDEDLCRHMAEAGCERVSIGVETLHPEVFSPIKKGETIEQIKAGISTAVKYIKNVNLFLIIGLPGDNIQRSLYSYKEVKKLKASLLQYAIAVPYSGTRLEKWVQENATPLISSYETFTRGSSALEQGVAFETSDFTETDRIKVFKILSTKDYQYLSRFKKNNLLNPLLWFRDAILYDTYNVHKHIFHILKRILSMITKFKKVSITSADIEYTRIPDGTWWIG